jgi:radical SAM superfamily enzyme YgiQ (UPF0313 family)
MNILLYNPGNEVTRNFMPHLWMFVIQALTPREHQVFLIDGNAQPVCEEEIVRFVKKNDIQLAGIGAMTRMAAKAYRIADAIRTTGAKVVMGGPHVTEVPNEAIGRDGEPRHADAVALGEADKTWPEIVRDAEKGELREIYEARDDDGEEVKPSLEDYPLIPWEKMDLDQFNLIERIPSWVRFLMNRAGIHWKSLYLLPIETGRGCPYGCDFCTVTGFFGSSVRFRSDQSVVEEMLRLKSMAKAREGKVGVFFIDDNFAINRKRTKSLLREIIARDAALPWVGQVSINLLRDEELIDLLAASGCRWIFIGLESIDEQNLKAMHKGFNNPQHYEDILKKLAERGIYAITSFIFGMDGDSRGVADRTVTAMQSWPPGLPVFGLLTPYPATPLYDRLLQENRLTRPKHWLDFRPFKMTFTPEGLSEDEAEEEVLSAWRQCYEPKAIAAALKKIETRPFTERAVLFFTKIAFRGIYLPQFSAGQWISLLFGNRQTLFQLIREGFLAHRNHRRKARLKTIQPPAEEPIKLDAKLPPVPAAAVIRQVRKETG